MSNKGDRTAPAGEEQPDDADAPATPESERAARTAMMRWHLIRLLMTWRTGDGHTEACRAAHDWARSNDVGKAALDAIGKGSVKLASAAPAGAGALTDEQIEDALAAAGIDFYTNGKVEGEATDLFSGVRALLAAPAGAGRLTDSDLIRLLKAVERGDTVFRCGWNGAIDAVRKLLAAHTTDAPEVGE